MPDTPRRDAGVIVFDADDTLWTTAPLYELSRIECRGLCRRLGLDAGEWDALQLEHDKALIATYHFGREQFPAACAAAYRDLAQRHGLPADEATAQLFYAAGDAVFHRAAPLKPGIERVLRELSTHHTLVLLTKGEDAVQQERLDRSGLRKYFDEVVVVGDGKPPELFRDICERHGASPAQSWSVGNSLPSDINPALQAGLSAVWVDADVWDYERRENTPLPGHLIRSEFIARVPAAIAKAELQREQAPRPLAEDLPASVRDIRVYTPSSLRGLDLLLRNQISLAVLRRRDGRTGDAELTAAVRGEPSSLTLRLSAWVDELAGGGETAWMKRTAAASDLDLAYGIDETTDAYRVSGNLGDILDFVEALEAHARERCVVPVSGSSIAAVVTASIRDAEHTARMTDSDLSVSTKKTWSGLRLSGEASGDRLGAAATAGALADSLAAREGRRTLSKERRREIERALRSRGREVA